MSETSGARRLAADKLAAVLEPGGPLSLVIRGYESRSEQNEMLADVIAAYNDGKVALIEAGTGTGKSIAYLLPAIVWALQTKERTLISTNTITLQEQLLHKDIPLLVKALNIPIKAVLVKGMGNYLCMRKLHDSLRELGALDREQQLELERIAAWEHNSDDGSRSDLAFTPRAATWERVCAESDSCTREQCPYYKECYFFKARKEAADAQILIGNHSLLFSDLSYRMENDTSILPEYQRLIIDEAHNIEEIATEHLASKVSSLLILKTLAKLMAENLKGERAAGKLPLLKRQLKTSFSAPRAPDIESLLLRLETIIPGLKEEVNKQLHETFDLYKLFLEESGGSRESEREESKLRLLPRHFENAVWREKILPSTEALIAAICRLAETLSALEGDIKSLGYETFEEQTQGVRADITALAGRLAATGQTLKAFIASKPPAERVHWIESYQTRNGSNVSLVAANLNIAPMLADHLFSIFPTVVLCSATLTTNRNFTFIRDRLGITPELLGKREISESAYISPFDYSKQSLLAIPSDLPLPSAPNFNDSATEKIWDAIVASKGNAFVLFTSYGMMRYCYERLADKLDLHRFPAMKQGDSSRHHLLQQFKETDRSVLFGTDSFWEGVDVSGEALRCVILVKLPFKVPTEPIIQARAEAIEAEGGSAFIEYSLPQAIMKFKQGFGRLIRNKSDRGCIVCLDTRLINKSYGAAFLNSLPACPKVIGNGEVVKTKMVDFYKKSYRLVAEASETAGLIP